MVVVMFAAKEGNGVCFGEKLRGGILRISRGPWVKPHTRGGGGGGGRRLLIWIITGRNLVRSLGVAAFGFARRGYHGSRCGVTSPIRSGAQLI